MYNRTQEAPHQGFHGNYHPSQQQRWPDQRPHIRQDFINLPPPPPQTTRIGNRGPVQPMQGLASQDHIQVMEMKRPMNRRDICQNYPRNVSQQNHMHASFPSNHQMHPGVMVPPPRQHIRPETYHSEISKRLGSQVNAIPTYNSSQNVVSEVKHPYSSDHSDIYPVTNENVHTPNRTTSTKRLFEITSEQSCNTQPLQSIDSNVNTQTEKIESSVLKKITPSVSTPQPGSSAKGVQPVQQPMFEVMSPITMCFTRMLGAAEMLKTPAGKEPVKKESSMGELTTISTDDSKHNKKNGSLMDENGDKSNLNDVNPFDELAKDEELERLVVLQMAMQRHQFCGLAGTDEDGINFTKENTPESPKRPVSNIISEGFFWREYQACEQVLYKHMERYYEVSAIQRNYKVQQSFNNVLVQEVRAAAENSGFTFEESFDDKKLRDRIRCFYKTHLQNAKKRLATLQKHPDSLENRCLVAVYIRCVRDRNLSFLESLAMAPEFPKKRRRMDKVEKLKFDLAATDATFAARYKNKKDRLSIGSSNSQQYSCDTDDYDTEF